MPPVAFKEGTSRGYHVVPSKASSKSVFVSNPSPLCCPCFSSSGSRFLGQSSQNMSLSPHLNFPTRNHCRCPNVPSVLDQSPNSGASGVGAWIGTPLGSTDHDP